MCFDQYSSYQALYKTSPGTSSSPKYQKLYYTQNRSTAMSARTELRPADVLELAMGFQKTQILYTATSLGIFDELDRNETPQSAHLLALKLTLDPDATERLLNACSALNLLEKVSTKHAALYKNTACTSKMLSSSAPDSIKPLVRELGNLYQMYGKLEATIQKRQDLETEKLTDDFFKLGNNLYASSEKQTQFLRVMHMYSSVDACHAVKAFDLSSFATCVELGGGTGALSLKLAQTYPNMRVTLTDLDSVLCHVEHFLPKQLPSNFRKMHKDFLRDQLEEADLYVMSHVIHDWNDYWLDLILKKVFTVIKPGGALLVFERVLNENKDGPLNTLLLDLGMLVGPGGRERSAEEYQNLLENNGFEKVEIVRLPEAKYRDAILARKIDINNNEI